MELSKAEKNVPFDPNNYEDTAQDLGLAKREIGQYLEVPSQIEYEEQQELLEGKDRANWIKFTKKAKETLDLEALLHQCNSVTELGWEPAPSSYPTNL